MGENSFLAAAISAKILSQVSGVILSLSSAGILAMTKSASSAGENETQLPSEEEEEE